MLRFDRSDRRHACALVAAIDAAGTDRERLAAYVRGCVDFTWTRRTQCQALAEVFRNLRRADGTLRYSARENEEPIAAVQALLVPECASTGRSCWSGTASAARPSPGRRTRPRS